MKLYTADKETGTFIEEVATINDGLELIALYEAEDKMNGGCIEPNFYDVVNENHESVLNN